MTAKEYVLIPLFEKFITDSYKGKRLKADGSKLRPQTVDNYVYVLRYLKEYEIPTPWFVAHETFFFPSHTKQK